MTVSNDGLIECQSLRLNYTDGLMIFSGLTKNVHTTNDGNMTTAGTIRMDGSNSSTTDAISFYDTATQTKLWSIKNNGATVLKSLSLTGTLGVYATGASTPNIELDQNGKTICNDFQLDNESGNGFKCYGVNTAGSRMLTSSITQNGAMTCASLAITDRTPGAAFAKASVGQDGNINCEHIECTQLSADTRIFQFPVETIVLDNVRLELNLHKEM